MYRVELHFSKRRQLLIPYFLLRIAQDKVSLVLGWLSRMAFIADQDSLGTIAQVNGSRSRRC